MEVKKGLPDHNGVKEGYKRTEVGVIPEDWEVRPLRPMLKQNPSYGINAAAVPLKGDLPVYIRITDISDEGYFMPSQRVGVDHPLSGKYYLDKGDLVFARTGASVGKSYLYDPDDGKLVYAGFLIKITPDEKVLSPAYLSQYVKTQTYWGWVQIMSMRSGQPGINGNEYGQLLLPLPPTKAEQTAIAAALSDADALIQSLEKLIAKKRLIKQGAMQELLKPKEGWVVKKLGEICEVYSGGTPSTSVPSYYGGNISWINSGDLNKGLIDEVDGRITEEGLSSSSAKMVQPETLLIALYGATSGVSAISKIAAAINQAVLAIIPNKTMSNVFLFYILSYLKDWIIVTYTQGGQPNLSGNIIKSIEITSPSIEEQTRIATILSDMDAEISALETKLTKYKQVKQGMMQNLLTGKIRLV